MQKKFTLADELESLEKSLLRSLVLLRAIVIKESITSLSGLLCLFLFFLGSCGGHQLSVVHISDFSCWLDGQDIRQISKANKLLLIKLFGKLKIAALNEGSLSAKMLKVNV